MKTLEIKITDEDFILLTDISNKISTNNFFIDSSYVDDYMNLLLLGLINLSGSRILITKVGYDLINKYS